MRGGGTSIGRTANYYLNLCNKTNKCTPIKYVLSYVHYYQHVSVTFVIIIRVALHEYQEYNKLSNDISLTTKRYNECLKFSLWSQNVSLCTVKIRYNSVVKNKWILVYCMFNILTYLLTYLLTHSLTYLLTYLLTYFLTYLLTCLFHGAESFLRSYPVFS